MNPLRVELRRSRLGIGFSLLVGLLASGVVLQLPVALAVPAAVVVVVLLIRVLRREWCAPCTGLLWGASGPALIAAAEPAPVAVRLLAFWDLSPWLLQITVAYNAGDRGVLSGRRRLWIWRDSCGSDTWRRLSARLHEAIGKTAPEPDSGHT